jgi:hypothetical protein
MAKHLLDDLRMLAPLQQQRGCGMPKIMDSQSRQKCQRPPPIRGTTSSKLPVVPWLLWTRKLLALDGMAVIPPEYQSLPVPVRSAWRVEAASCPYVDSAGSIAMGGSCQGFRALAKLA